MIDMPAIRSPKVITVLVTGFGPWGDVTDNPSEHVAKALPSSLLVNLPPSRTKGPKSATDTDAAPPSGHTVKVDVIIHTPLRTAYKHTKTVLTDLLEKYSPDLTLNIGVASARTYFAAECSALGADFKSPDADGEVFPNLPHGPLHTTLEYDSVVESWIEKVSKISVPKDADKDGEASLSLSTTPPSGCIPYFLSRGFGSSDLKAEARKSDNVGNFLCGFSYHLSLTHYLELREGKEGRTLSATTEGKEEDKKIRPGGPALFLHVPNLPTPAHIALGAKVATALLESMVVGFVEQSGI